MVPDQSEEDTFFHISAVDDDYEFDPAEGDLVSYIVGLGKDGRAKAVSVTILTKDATPFRRAC